MEPSRTLPQYIRPPVVERVVSVYAAVSEETFMRGNDDWALQVSPEFPEFEPLKDWEIPIREMVLDDGEVIPILDESMEPQLKITPRFSKKRSKDGFDWSIRCPAGQFTMNMHSKPGTDTQDRRYPHLRAEMARWFPLWSQRFDVDRLNRISLHYVNILNMQTAPSFYSKGAFRIGDVITIFSNIPGDFESITPPFESTVTVKLKGRENAFLRMVVKDWPKSVESAVQVDFQAFILFPDEGVPVVETIPLLDWLHDHIVNQFERIFTTEAKKSFGVSPV